MDVHKRYDIKISTNIKLMYKMRLCENMAFPGHMVISILNMKSTLRGFNCLPNTTGHNYRMGLKSLYIPNTYNFDILIFLILFVG